MNNIYKTLFFTLLFSFHFSTEAFLRTFARGMVQPTKHVVEKLVQKNETYSTLKTLHANKQDHKMIGSIFLQRLGINISGATAFTQIGNTTTFPTILAYGIAVAHALRGTLRQYGQFLRNIKLERSIEEAKTTILGETKAAISKTEESLQTQLTHMGTQTAETFQAVHNTVKTTTNGLQEQLTTMRTTTADNFQSVHTTLAATKDALHNQVKGTESILANQMDRLHSISHERIGNLQETLDNVSHTVALTHQQLPILTKEQRAILENQKKLLELFLNTLTPEQRKTLGRIQPL